MTEENEANYDLKTQMSEINQNVLQADLKPMTGTGELLADQAGGMLLQDVEAFSQGYMQIMTAAIGKVAAEIVATDGAKGKTAMQDLQKALGDLPGFITKMSTAAAAMEKMNIKNTINLSSTQGTNTDHKLPGFLRRRDENG